jgi:hypothetical protein
VMMELEPEIAEGGDVFEASALDRYPGHLRRG